MSVRALFVVRDGRTGDRRDFYRLDEQQPLTVGRSRSGEIVLADPSVTARHLRVWLEGGELRAEDLKSRNGSYLVRPNEEIRLEPGSPVRLRDDDAIRVGPYLLVPCEMLGDDVALCSNPLVEITTQSDVPGATSAESRDNRERDPALQALARAMQGEFPRDVWDNVLDGLVQLGKAHSACLLVHDEGRFLLRASRGVTSVSQCFLETTLERHGAWRFTPSLSESTEISSPSIHSYGPEVVLVGVRFTSASGEPRCVGYLESRAGDAPGDLENLTSFAEACGPLLEMAEALDRANRRCDAAEARLRRERGTDVSQPDVTGAREPVGASARFRAAIEAVTRAAQADATILVRGPSGSGKEELARLAHERSKRRERPLLVVNCAALPETLIESELFGADRGAYTGAVESRKGAFSQADGGTLFLDEIGDLPLTAQAKILRVIETGEVVRVGGSRHRVDVRLVAATHRDLEAMISEGTFREDLYYRLRVVEVTLPPLADRPEDIALLAEHFLAQFRRTDGSRVVGISVRAANALAGYGWPGNVRELRNVIERAVVLDRDGVLDLDDLPHEVAAASGKVPPAVAGNDLQGVLEQRWSEAKAWFEEVYFGHALDRCDGVVQRTAEETGVNRRTLSDKIRRYGLKGKPG